MLPKNDSRGLMAWAFHYCIAATSVSIHYTKATLSRQYTKHKLCKLLQVCCARAWCLARGVKHLSSTNLTCQVHCASYNQNCNSYVRSRDSRITQYNRTRTTLPPGVASMSWHCDVPVTLFQRDGTRPCIHKSMT